jgi:hypothetical protein
LPLIRTKRRARRQWKGVSQQNETTKEATKDPDTTDMGEKVGYETMEEE